MKFLVFATVLVLCLAAAFADESTLPTCQQTPAVVGPCRAIGHRYSYHPDTNECRRFIYGGCQGNSNNFESQAMCETACKPDA